MLRQLYIRNFTLIDQLDIEFGQGFSVITGETGAGKSIILGALGLLLGNRADTKAIKAGADKCIVEAHFDISRYSLDAFFTDNDIDNDDPADCILRREVNSNGKSRAFINDQPVALTALREIGEALIDIHSQHKNLLLGKEDFQLGVLDIIADNTDLLHQYQQSFADYREAERQLQQLKDDMQQAQANEDFLRFQFGELDEARLTEGEQTEMEQELSTLEHVEDIKSSLFEADRLLSSDEQNAISNLRNASAQLSRIESVYPEVKELAARINSTYIEIKDIADEVSSRLERVSFDPHRLEQITQRLDLLYALERKYRVDTVEELITLRDNLKQKLSTIDNSAEQLAEQEAIVCRHAEKSKGLAKRLTTARTKAATIVEKEMQKRLTPLGIPSVVFNVSLSEKPLSADGTDKVSFLFSANRSTPAQPIANVASGGEIARVMLSLKAMISGAVKLPTIIFDEIDTGVSGRIAEKMAEMMYEMGCHDRQVISITHLPQIAAMGTTHYKVVKEETAKGTVSNMRKLTADERISEIAQMLSGSNISEAAIENAKALMRKK